MFKIGKTKIGGNNPCFVVAEIGINFNGKLDQAFALIDSAKNAGCNAVKFQLFTAEKMYVPNAGEDKSGGGRKKDIFKIVKEAELLKEWIPLLKEYANENGLEFFSTVCDEESADILEKFGADAYKIASYEITHIPLLRHVAKKKKPIIFSSGASNLREIMEALEVFKSEKNDQIALLHCVSEYGVNPDFLNLDAINVFKTIFPNIIIGFSDHSSDPVSAPAAAVLAGAKIIEKHITLDKSMQGPDHFFALDPKELALMVKAIREADVAQKQTAGFERKVSEGEKIARNFTHRCVFAIENIKKGEKLTKKNIAVLRPGNQKTGLAPKYYELLVKGYKATKSISKYKSVNWEDILSK